MGVLVVKINDELEQEFRRYAFMVFGQRKGSLSRAVEEAIRLWLANVRNESKISFKELEVRVPPNKKSIVSEVLKDVNKVERERVQRMLKALGVM